MAQSEPQSLSAWPVLGGKFIVGDWLVSPDTHELKRGEKVIRLEPKVMQLLLFLKQHHGEVVTRKMLEENVWGDMVVGYDAITNAVIKLRKALGDSARKPVYIETIPKNGYRLVAKVQKYDAGRTATAKIKKKRVISKKTSKRLFKIFLAATFVILLSLEVVKLLPSLHNTAQPLLPDQPSIAVIPFLNTGNDPRQTYFSDGISEDLITGLSNVTGLFVIARNSSFKYKNQGIDVKSVAEELGVRYLLQGSVRKNTEQVRLNVQLTDSQTGSNIWAERYDTPLDELFTLQDEITRKITNALSVRLTQHEQQQLTLNSTKSLASYDEFLKGWERYWRFSREDFAIAEKHFIRALEIDPDNTRANAALALIYWQTWQQKWHENLGIPNAGWTRAITELEKAMRNPTPLAHSTKSAMMLINRRYEQAIAEAERAISLNANHASGYLALADAQSYSGQPGLAIETAKKGMRLDPNFVAPYLFVISRSQLDMLLYEQAIESAKRAVAVNPRDRDSRIVLISALGHIGKLDEAKTVLKKLNEAHKSQNMRPFSVDWLKNRWPYRKKSDRDHLIEGLIKAGVPQW